jgi:hypothetical protein
MPTVRTNQVQAGGEDMLDADSYLGAGAIAASDVCWHLASSRLLSPKLWFQAMSFEQGQIRDIAETTEPGVSVSETIRAFSSTVQ